MNKTMILGRLGRDPETRFTADGTKVVSLLVATSIYKAGGEDTIWWRVSLWGDRFDKLISYLKKGSAVVVSGEISRKPEVYTDKNGQAQVSTLELRAESINFSPWGGKNDQSGGESEKQGSQSYSGGGNESGNQYGSAPSNSPEYNEEEVPF